MQNTLVSIITPSYKSKRFISQTIESVIAQTYENWEMLIVDDCSPDDSNELIEKYCKKDSRIKLIKLEKNSGPAIARNRAIEESKGRYIAFLDSDDYWHKDKLLKQLQFMQADEILLSFTAYDIVEETTLRYEGTMSAPTTIDYHTLLKQNILGCLTVIYDSAKLGKVYMPIISKRQDFALWLKILKQTPYAYGLNESLAYYRMRKISVSSNKIESSLYNWKLYRHIEKLPLYQAIYYFSCYVYNSIFHKRNRK